LIFDRNARTSGLDESEPLKANSIMNETPTERNDTPETPETPSGEMHQDPPAPADPSVLHSIADALRKGAEDARKAANQAVPTLQSAAADAAYWLAFGVSFAAALPCGLARQLAPEVIKSGCRDGLESGRRAAERITRQLTRQNKDAEPNPAASLESVDPEPGSAF
jgi:hypothetical protein